MIDLPDIKDLLEAGAHFGHQTKRWNPKMSQYIFTEKNDIHIIDLTKTLEKLRVALDFLESEAAKGNVLFVGTKRQAQEIVEESAKRIGASYVTNRWVGGLLTNFNITRTNVKKMLDLEEKMASGFENRTKQEVSLLGKELERLQRLYGGIRHLTSKPSIIVLADPNHEKIAVKEANKLRIPIVAVVDTNCNPDEVTYEIPGNDDAIGSIALFFDLFSKAVESGMKNMKKEEPKEEKKEEVVKVQVEKKEVKAKKATKSKSVEKKEK